MKTRFLLVITCLCLSIFGNGLATSYGDNPPNQTAIVLIGQLDNNQGPNDVEAYTDQVNVYVVFHRSFGVVNITLYNESWVSIYSNVVDTAIQQTVIIPISGTPSGIYSVLLENGLGFSEGDFSKTN